MRPTRLDEPFQIARDRMRHLLALTEYVPWLGAAGSGGVRHLCRVEDAPAKPWHVGPEDLTDLDQIYGAVFVIAAWHRRVSVYRTRTEAFRAAIDLPGPVLLANLDQPNDAYLFEPAPLTVAADGLSAFQGYALVPVADVEPEPNPVRDAAERAEAWEER